VKGTVTCFGISLIRRKRHGFLSVGVCLQHDNDRSHTARHTVKQIKSFELEVFPIRHIYRTWRPAILTSFGPRKTLYGRHVTSDEEVMEAVHDRLAQQRRLLIQRIYVLVERWKRCRTWWGRH
jgi:hypothetical protein